MSLSITLRLWSSINHQQIYKKTMLLGTQIGLRLCFFEKYQNSTYKWFHWYFKRVWRHVTTHNIAIFSDGNDVTVQWIYFGNQNILKTTRLIVNFLKTPFYNFFTESMIYLVVTLPHIPKSWVWPLKNIHVMKSCVCSRSGY